MKRIAILLLTAALLSPQLSAATWLKSMSAAQAQAKKNDQLIFVDLFAQWCGWCHRMEQEVFPSETFQKATTGMVLLRLDTEDRAEGTRFAQEFGIQSLPTFLILDKDAMLAGVITGYAPPTPFTEKLRDEVSLYGDFRDRIRKEPTIQKDYSKRLDLAKEFIARRGYAGAETRLKALLAEKGTPRDVRDLTRYHLALVQFDQKKYDASLAAANQLLASSPAAEAAELSTLLVGQVYLEQGKYSPALAAFRKFKKNFPNSPRTGSVDMILPQLEKAAAGNK